MWEPINADPCDICQHSRSTKPVAMSTDVDFDKENLQSFSPTKNEDLSMYESNSPVRFTETSPSRCSHNIIRRPLEDQDSSSLDSGYGASYIGENGKHLSYTSSARNLMSFGSGSLCSMEDEYFDFSDVEPLEKPNALPEDFSKLIADPLIQKSHPVEKTSPKDTIVRPLFRRALSLQNPRITPPSSRIRTSLFKNADAEIRSFKRPEPPGPHMSTGVKRSKIFDEEEEASVPIARPILKHSISATEESIMYAVQRSSTEPDLIGDFSRNFCLPLTRTRHQDLKAITPTTLAQLIQGGYKDGIDSFKVIDCRYPYEFDGGHIEGALNIYTKEQCMKLLDPKQVPSTSNSQKRHVLVFHCEFSSERGPNLCRYLRKEDRHKNEDAYPSLCYPEIYLLEGGYKNFFQQFAGMCIPIAYKEMLHPDHEEDLKRFRQKSRTWNCDTRQRPQCGRSLKRLEM